jgi:serine/threonine-protein kinase
MIAGHMVLRIAGEGGAAVVYEARDRLDRSFALKVLRPEKAADPVAVTDFANEAEATAAVGHDNVVRVLGHGEEGGRHFILMEYVDGPPLHLLLAEKGRLPFAEATRIVLQVAEALRHAHGKGLVHRDVKPQNILLYRDGRARLTDFGIVKDISSLKGFLLKGRAVGTAAYASPEQCLDKRLDAATDMYSLGATFYHMLCGRPPFAGASRSETMKLHVGAEPPPPGRFAPDLPKPLVNTVLRMLAKRQTDRYPDMARLIHDLTKILEGKVAIADAGPRVDSRSVTAPKRTKPVVPPEAKKSRISPEAVIFVILLLAAAGITVAALLL